MGEIYVPGTYGKVMFPHEFTIKHAVSPVDVDFITKKTIVAL